jgi:hypothetical protein
MALTAWCSGHRLRQQNRRSWVRISPGCKVFRTFYIEMLFCVTIFLPTDSDSVHNSHLQLGSSINIKTFSRVQCYVIIVMIFAIIQRKNGNFPRSGVNVIIFEVFSPKYL